MQRRACRSVAIRFREPPLPSAYGDAFLERFRAAQAERVQRIDARARAILAVQETAAREAEAPGFAERPEPERRALLRRRACEPVMVVYRTMANPAYVDPRIVTAYEQGSSIRPTLDRLGKRDANALTAQPAVETAVLRLLTGT